jgi:hypothetical protein
MFKKASCFAVMTLMYTNLFQRALRGNVFGLIAAFDVPKSGHLLMVYSVWYFRRTCDVGTHVKWVPYHHGMARPQVADSGDGLQIWRVAANILNKQSWTADRGWPSSFGFARGCARMILLH